MKAEIFTLVSYSKKNKHDPLGQLYKITIPLSQVSRTLLNNLADFNNAVVKIVSIFLLHFFSFLFQAFGDQSKSINYYYYHHHPHVSLISELSGKILVLSYTFAFLNFHAMVE